MKTLLTLCSTLIFSTALKSPNRPRVLNNNYFLDNILPKKEDGQSQHGYVDDRFREIDDNFGFVFDKPSEDSAEKREHANDLITNFMTSMLASSLGTATCEQLKTILTQPRPYGPGMHDLSNQALEQYIAEEKNQGHDVPD